MFVEELEYNENCRVEWILENSDGLKEWKSLRKWSTSARQTEGRLGIGSFFSLSTVYNTTLYLNLERERAQVINQFQSRRKKR